MSRTNNPSRAIPAPTQAPIPASTTCTRTKNQSSHAYRTRTHPTDSPPPLAPHRRLVKSPLTAPRPRSELCCAVLPLLILCCGFPAVSMSTSTSTTFIFPHFPSKNRHADFHVYLQTSGNMAPENTSSERESTSCPRDGKKCSGSSMARNKAGRKIRTANKNADEGEVARDSCVIMQSNFDVRECC